jgi:hypothetical protein
MLGRLPIAASVALVALAVLSIAAGGLVLGSSGDDDTTMTTSGDRQTEGDQDPGLSFEEPRALPPCDLSGELRSCTLAKEPTFAVGPGEELWMTGAGAVGTTSQIWYSPDLGDSFEHIGFQGTDAGRHTAGAEGDVAVDPQGTAFLFDTNLAKGWWTVFEDPQLPTTSIPLAFTGESPTAGQFYPVDDLDRPWLIGLGEDEVFFTYNDGDTTYRITRDGGLTWSDPVTVTDCNLGRPLHLDEERFAFVSSCLLGHVEDDGSTTWVSSPHLYVPKDAPEPGILEQETDAWEAVPVETPVHDGSGDEVARDALPIMDLARADDTWFVVGADEPTERAYLSWGGPDQGWETTWLGEGEHSWFPAVDAREDGLVGVAYPSLEEDAWRIRAELRTPNGEVLDSVVVDPGTVAPPNETRPHGIGDFIDVGWLPDGRLLVAYGDNPSGGDGIPEAESLISYARGTVVGEPIP